MPLNSALGPIGSDALYLDAAAGVTAAVLAGRYLEARAKDRSGAALTTLAGLGAKTVAVLRDGAEQLVPAETLAVGERFVVRPGEKIATDGVVLEGSSAVDRSLVTGESMPAEVIPGDEITGATVNMSGRLVGLPAAAAWSNAVAVLVVACPCALGRATPAALLAGLGRGAELGILVKSAQALERAGRIRAVVLDKTGTLTTGVMTVHKIATAAGTDEKDVWLLAGAVEHASGHPIGRAVAAEAAGRLGTLPPMTGFTTLPGAGV
jgi:P-type Cu+ transporter